jgi:hypothetical protein
MKLVLFAKLLDEGARLVFVEWTEIEDVQIDQRPLQFETCADDVESN